MRLSALILAGELLTAALAIGLFYDAVQAEARSVTGWELHYEHSKGSDAVDSFATAGECSEALPVGPRFRCVAVH